MLQANGGRGDWENRRGSREIGEREGRSKGKEAGLVEENVRYRKGDVEEESGRFRQDGRQGGSQAARTIDPLSLLRLAPPRPAKPLHSQSFPLGPTHHSLPSTWTLVATASHKTRRSLHPQRPFHCL